jgi:hypothetical protein
MKTLLEFLTVHFLPCARSSQWLRDPITAGCIVDIGSLTHPLTHVPAILHWPCSVARFLMKPARTVGRRLIAMLLLGVSIALELVIGNALHSSTAP